MPTFTEPVDLCGMTMYWLPMLVGETVVPIRTEEFIWGDLREMLHWAGLLPSLHVLLNKPEVRRACTLLRVAYVMNSVVQGVAWLIVDSLKVATLL